jgi:hypothetical protein
MNVAKEVDVILLAGIRVVHHETQNLCLFEALVPISLNDCDDRSDSLPRSVDD